MVEQHSEKFIVLRDFQAATVNSAVRYAQSNIDIIDNHLNDKKFFLFIARDLETSILESKCFEFLSSDLKEFNFLMRKLIEDTLEHRKMLNQKIEDYAKP